MIQLYGAARTDTGRVRAQNEDALGFFPEVELFAVADGMGGHAGGAVASELTIETLRRSLTDSIHRDLTPMVDAAGRSSVGGRLLLIALNEANESVLEASRNDPRLNGMGAAVAAVMLDKRFGQLAIGHVGDTRVYRIRAGVIQQLTEDHTLVQQFVREGRIQPENVHRDPNRHVLTQAIGVAPMMNPSLRLEEPRPDDLYILTSDGVHDVISSSEIQRIVISVGTDLEEACIRLISLANERGGRDNASVLVLRCDERKSGEDDDDDPTLEH